MPLLLWAGSGVKGLEFREIARKANERSKRVVRRHGEHEQSVQAFRLLRLMGVSTNTSRGALFDYDG